MGEVASFRYCRQSLFNKETPMPYLLLTLSSLIWSGNFVLSRAMNATIPPAGFVFWRWLVAALILAPVALPKLRREWPIVRANLRLICICGFFGVTLFNFLIYTAMHTTTAINAALVNSSIPVFIIMFARVFYGQRVTLRQHTGIALSLAGVATIVLQGELARFRTLSFNRGDLLVLVAAVAWALYSVALRRYPQGLNPFLFLFCISICGLAFLIPFYGLEIASGHLMTANPATVLSVAYVGIFASVVAFTTWNSGLRKVGPHLGGQFVHLMPAFSTILAVIFLGEQLHPFHLAGIALIFTGILCATLGTVKPPLAT
jgi:drug/metabolite transporter (DMT)-like permease